MKSPTIRLPTPVFAVILGAMILGLCFHSSAAPRPRFTVTDLGTLPGSFGTFPTKINNRGQVVGYTMEAGAQHRPFLYSDGVMTAIPVPSGYGVAVNINDAGMVVGQMNPARGFVYSEGVVTDLNPILGVDWSAAAGINDKGQIVGWADLAKAFYPAFLISNGVPGLFPKPANGYTAQAHEINNAGQAAGDVAVFTNEQSTKHRAAIFQNGTVVELGTLPGGIYSAARAISENGDVVGWSGVDIGDPAVRNRTHACLYRGGEVIDLGTLPIHYESNAHDVNSAGWVVGRSGDGDARAFLYADGQMHDLNDLVKDPIEWALGSAEGVNELGQIVGWSFVDGQFRGFLLTPQHKLKPKSRR